METEKNIALGMSPDDARTRALRSFGPMEKHKEETRDARGVSWLETLVADLRYGARALVKRPGYAALAILTLGLGIGANTAIFSVINGVLLKPLPYEHGDRLVVLQQSRPLSGQPSVGVAIAEYYDYRQRATDVFDGLVEYHQMNFDLINRGEPDRVDTGVVSANFFDLLGIKPIVGRTFVAERRCRGRRGGAGAQPHLLAHQVRRRPEHRRPGVRDERPAAPRDWRAAQRAALPAGERRLHAGAGVSVPRQRRAADGAEPPRLRGAERVRPAQAGRRAASRRPARSARSATPSRRTTSRSTGPRPRASAPRRCRCATR